MRKVAICTAVLFLSYSETKACAWYEPDYDYFNLFTQTIIRDKSYVPFLHTLSNRFYGHEHFEIDDENIISWQKYFGNILNYPETQALVTGISLSELRAYKNGKSNNAILNKLGSYQKYSEGIDYLMEAKYLEPYMRINFVESPDTFYYQDSSGEKNATALHYAKTVTALTSLYNAAQHPEIKLRYGYQLVRFQHYTRHYQQAIDAFKNYVTLLNQKSNTYFMALDQVAGAQRGLKMNSEANWNFFKVFENSANRKESAFVSMKLSDSASFENLLKRAESPQEKNMAYFLLAYDNFTNPIPLMEKMYAIDPNSEILKVLAARSVNELERSYLPIYVSGENTDSSRPAQTTDAATNQNTEVKTEQSFWQRIKNFFIHLFSSDKKSPNKEINHDQLNNPNRLPFYSKSTYDYDDKSNNFLADFEKLTSKVQEKSNDEFWKITYAYLKFLQKDYEQSSEILNQINTQNLEYLAEIERMKMLNDIVSIPEITTEKENELLEKYPKFFNQLFAQNPDRFNLNEPTTQDFIKDILANRYFLQDDLGKSFLLSNSLSDLQYNPNIKLAKAVETFINKANKTKLEEKIIANSTKDFKDPSSFFNMIYGDQEMRKAKFSAAVEFYKKAVNFSGIPRMEYSWDDQGNSSISPKSYGENYNGFSPISSLIFGHNVWESFSSSEKESMKAANLGDFPFIKTKMTKLELAENLVQLEKIGQGNSAQAANANQLIGNLLYNTSSLGYYREIFVMDTDNSNGPKYQFYNTEQPAFKYYYKNFAQTSFVEADNFDLSISYYNKALQQSQDPETKARILFQMASAEQGKFYQYEAKDPFEINYSDPNYEQKQNAHEEKMAQVKNQQFRKYFTELKKNYSGTATSKSLQSSCMYYEYFLRK